MGTSKCRKKGYTGTHGQSDVDFLAQAQRLVEEYQRVMQGGDAVDAPIIDESHLDTLQTIDDRLSIYKDLLPELMERATPHRDLGGVMLMVTDWDEYCVAPWIAPYLRNCPRIPILRGCALFATSTDYTFMTR